MINDERHSDITIKVSLPHTLYVAMRCVAMRAIVIRLPHPDSASRHVHSEARIATFYFGNDFVKPNSILMIFGTYAPQDIFITITYVFHNVYKLDNRVD